MPLLSRTEFRRAFIARVRQVRAATGRTQAEMAEALDISAKLYESYETRSLLPHDLIAQFAQVTQVPIDSLFSKQVLAEALRKQTAGTGARRRAAAPAPDKSSDRGL